MSLLLQKSICINLRDSFRYSCKRTYKRIYKILRVLIAYPSKPFSKADPIEYLNAGTNSIYGNISRNMVEKDQKGLRKDSFGQSGANVNPTRNVLQTASMILIFAE